MAAEFELGSALLGLELRLEALKHLNWQPPPDLCHAQPSGSALSTSQAAASALAPPPESATPLPHLTSTILAVKPNVQVHVRVGIIPAFATHSEDFHITQHSLNLAC